MIGRLKGTLLRKEPPALLVDVGGVGYELEAPMTTFYDLPAVGETVTLHTHQVVREDAHLLYGFVREDQRQLFRALLKVTGIGPRIALAVLSGMSADDLALAVAGEDIARLSRVPGIGRKTAERLVMELRDKITAPTGVPTTAPGGPTDPAGEAVSALIALGYKPNEAARAVRVAQVQGASAEDIIRQALKSMAG
ncbi:MAG: Holliday junction branch migration protein RuvA [Pseudomonadota bacterium]